MRWFLRHPRHLLPTSARLFRAILVWQLFAGEALSQEAPAWEPDRRVDSLLEKLGLTHFTIHHFSFEKDEKGGIRYVWIATSGGLYRYDGYSTERFGKEQGLPSDVIRCALVTSKGQLWLGTPQGAGIFDGKRFSTAGAEHGLVGRNVRRIVEDRQGTLWFASDSWPSAEVDAGLSRLRDGQWTQYRAKQGLPSGFVVDQFTDSKGRIFAMTLEGPARLEGDLWKREPLGRLEPREHWGSSAMVETATTGVVLSNGFSTWTMRPEGWVKLGNPPKHNYGIVATRDGKVMIAGDIKSNQKAFFEWNGKAWNQVSDGFRAPQGWGIFLNEASDGSIWFGGPGSLSRWGRGNREWQFLAGGSRQYFLTGREELWALEGGRSLSELDGQQWVRRGVFDEIWWRNSESIWAIDRTGVTNLHSGHRRTFGEDETGIRTPRQIAVDSKGTVWAIGLDGSGKGLVSDYNGKHWHRHKVAELDPKNRVFQGPASEGGIWYATRNAASGGYRLARIEESGKREAHEIALGAVTTSPPGDLYFKEFGLNQWTKESGWGLLDSLPARRAASTATQGGRRWSVLEGTLGGREGLLLRTSTAEKFYPTELLTSLTRGADGSLLAGGNGRFFVIPDATGDDPIAVPVPNGERVSWVSRDRSGVFFAGTPDGLFRFQPDGIAPETRIQAANVRIVTGQPLRASALAFGRFEGDSSRDMSASYSWRLNDGAWSPFVVSTENPFDIAQLPLGTHKIAVRSRDNGLDVDATPAEMEFAIRAMPLQDQPWFTPTLLSMATLLGFTIYSAGTSRRKLAQESANALSRSLERYRHIVETAQEGIAVLDVDGNCTMANAEFSRIVGKPADMLVGRHYRDFVATGQLETFHRLFAAQRDGAPVNYRASLEYPHGVQHVQAGLRPIPHRDGAFTGSLFMLADIGEQTVAEEAMLRSATNYRLLFGRSPMSRMVVDRPTSKVLLVNSAACELYGYSKEEFLQIRLFDLQLPDQVDAARKMLTGDCPSEMLQGRHRKKDGTIFEVEIYAHDHSFEGHDCRSVLTLDQTGTILAANRVRDSREALASAQSIANIGSFAATIDKENRVVSRYWSDQMYRIMGLCPGQEPALGLSWMNYVFANDQAEVAYQLNLGTATGKPIEIEHRIVRADGLVRDVRTIVQPATDSNGSTRQVGTVQDVTELHRMQEQLQQAQRLDSIGRLAGGVAHDFNNLLTVINGYSKLLLRKLTPESPIHQDILQIADAGQEAAELTRRLLAYGRKQALKPVVLDLHEVLSDAMILLRRLAGEDVHIELEPPLIGSVTVLADLVQMNEILINLTTNARDAMPRGGVLIFGLENLGDQVRLSISDTGEGMDEATVKQIYEPFFTTKERQGGTGLGLASVHGIVHQSGGSIQCWSSPGSGTRFEILLPAVPNEAVRASSGKGEAARGQDAESENGLDGEGRVVLVVDDQADIRKFVAEVLKGCGYEVTTVSSGEEALDLLRNGSIVPALLVTDIVMRGMSGAELAARVVELKTDTPLPVLFMSGYTRSEIDEKGVAGLPGGELLEKPFAPETLLRLVAQSISRSKAH